MLQLMPQTFAERIRQGLHRTTRRSAQRLRQARIFEYRPLRLNPVDPERVYRSFKYGPDLEVFEPSRGVRGALRSTIGQR
jgi:phosphodiesterase/alkaline phosphatase D-like protein